MRPVKHSAGLHRLADAPNSRGPARRQLASAMIRCGGHRPLCESLSAPHTNLTTGGSTSADAGQSPQYRPGSPPDPASGRLRALLGSAFVGQTAVPMWPGAGGKYGSSAWTRCGYAKAEGGLAETSGAKTNAASPLVGKVWTVMPPRPSNSVNVTSTGVSSHGPTCTASTCAEALAGWVYT